MENFCITPRYKLQTARL